jgi:uncharacterized protein YukE
MPQYQDSVERIQTATENLLDASNWKGKAHDEFRDTYRIVAHYLDDDTTQISSIADILQGFKDIYDALDVNLASDLYNSVDKAVEAVENI